MKSAYRFFRIVVLLYAAALVWLQSEDIQSLRNIQNFLAYEVDRASALCMSVRYGVNQ